MVLIVDLSSTPATLSLRNPGDFASLAVSVIGGDGADSLVSAVNRVGRVSEDGRRAYIRVEALQELAGAEGERDGWTTSLIQMVQTAALDGHLSADGALQANVEWA